MPDGDDINRDHHRYSGILWEDLFNGRDHTAVEVAFLDLVQKLFNLYSVLPGCLKTVHIIPDDLMILQRIETTLKVLRTHAPIGNNSRCRGGDAISSQFRKRFRVDKLIFE